MKSVHGIIVAVAISAVGWMQVPAVAQTAEQTKQVEEGQKQAAAQLKPTLPRKIDELTTMTDVSAIGVVLAYTYAVDTTKFKMVPNFIDLVRKNTTAVVCKTEVLANAMKLGAVYRYIYVDPQTQPLGTFDVKSADCA
jgi:hypothetical protein